MDPAAEGRFTRMYEEHYDQILAYCARRVDRTEAEDIANEVFAVLWRRLDEVEPDTELAWLYGVAYRTIGGGLRTAKRRTRLSRRIGGLAHHGPELPDHVVVRRDQDRIVLEALAELRPSDAEVLRLRAWEELTAGEMAVVLGCSVPAAEQRLSRAKRRLARVLAPRLPSIAPPLAPEKGGRP